MTLGHPEMFSNMTSSIDREITPGQERLEASPASWLSLAAAPTFAMMALLTRIHGDSMSDILCSAAQDASPLTGMFPMYVLMSVFHLTPWLRLLSRRRSGAGRS
jgi:hypothetical protein